MPASGWCSEVLPPQDSEGFQSPPEGLRNALYKTKPESVVLRPSWDFLKLGEAVFQKDLEVHFGLSEVAS